MTTPAMIVASVSMILSVASLLAVAALARELGALLARIGPARPLASGSAGLEIGTVVEPLSLATVRGESMAIAPTKSSRQLLLFVSATCPICAELRSSIVPFARSYRGQPRVVVITKSLPTEEDVALDRRLSAYDGAVVEIEAYVPRKAHITGDDIVQHYVVPGR